MGTCTPLEGKMFHTNFALDLMDPIYFNRPALLADYCDFQRDDILLSQKL